MHINQKGFVNIFLIIVIIAVIAVDGYFVFVKKSGPVAQQPTPTPRQTNTPVPTPTPTLTPQKVNDNYINPVSIIIDEACLKSEYIEGSGQKITVNCSQLGEAVISSTVKVVLKSKHQTKFLTGNDYEFDVYLEFYENGNKLDVPPYYFPSFADANALWFGLSISYLDKNNIYISDSGGHEGYPSHYFFNGTSWNEFLPWDLVKNNFPDTIQPPFSVAVSPKYLKITEEHYCCDMVYSDTPDRKANRIVFILDRLSKQIVQTIKVSR